MKLKNFYLIVLSILILCYVIFIIVISDIGQKRLLDSQKKEIELELQNKVSTLNYLLKFQSQDIKNLSQNFLINSYFSNKALGMSMEYGLKANISKVENLFSNFLETRNIEDMPLFSSIALLDNENNIIVQKNFQDDIKYINNVFDINNEKEFITSFDDNKLIIFYFQSVYEKDRKIGYIVAKMNVNKIFPKLFLTDGNKKEYLIYNKRLVNTNTLEITNNIVPKEFITKNLDRTNLYIGVNSQIILEKDIYTSKTFIIILTILTLFIFIGILYLIRLNNKNIFLNTQMEVTNQLNEQLESKIDEKTKELKELNKNLEIRVQKEVQKNQENQRILYHQSKMAAMGEMLGNIAHQWRQPLSSISSYASGVKLQGELNILEKKDLNLYMDDIVDLVNFLSNTINDFRSFFSSNKEKNIFNLKETYERTYKILSSRFKNNDIELFVNIDEVEFYGYENELIQVLMNILNNAHDALIENNKSMKKLIFVDFYKIEKKLVIKIKDNANGIPTNIIEKIFDPYFTTKQNNDGTGIGLYMTKEIIENHMKGEIFVTNVKYVFQNEQYCGAEFIIRLDIEEIGEK